MSLLLVKVQWMPSYTGEDDVSDPWGRWAQAGSSPAERFNFLRQNDGKFYGYLRPSSGESVDIGNLGAAAGADYAEDVTVVFVAPQPDVRPRRPLIIVGYYQKARVHSLPITRSPDSANNTNIRLATKYAVSVPEELRSFAIPLKSLWGSGFYRSVDGDIETAIRAWLEAFDQTDDAVEQKYLSDFNPGSAQEWRVLRASTRLERRSSTNWRRKKLQSEGDYICACCDSKLPAKAHEALKLMFEVHHLAPFNMLEDRQIRHVVESDLAVVCANCHRAIHGTKNLKYIQNMDAFRTEILGKAARA